MNRLKLFYEDLYARKSAKTEQVRLSYLEEVNTPKLSEEDKDICEGKLSVYERWNALNSMQNGKSPGNDGLFRRNFMYAYCRVRGPTIFLMW